MEELVIRDPNNKRIRKLVKVDIKKEIEQESLESMNFVLFNVSQQISELFQLIDHKQSFGFFSEIASCIIGIDEYNSFDEKNKKRYNPQYNRSYNTLYTNLVNLSGQFIFSLKSLDDRLLDQIFIKKIIETIFFLQRNYINNNTNNILPAQKEFLSGLLKELIELYNKRIQHAVELCNKNDSWWSRITIFDNSMYNGCSYFEAFSNVLINSMNQSQYKQQLLINRIDISFKELPDNESNN